MRTMFLFITFCAAVDSMFYVDSHFVPKEMIVGTNQGLLNSHMAKKGELWIPLKTGKINLVGITGVFWN